MGKILALDLGSSNIKACVFENNENLDLVATKTSNVGLYSPKPGYAEHNADEVWESFCSCIKAIMVEKSIDRDEIECLSICSHAQCVVLVDKNGDALTPILNSQDARAVDTYKKLYTRGITVSGLNAFKVLKGFVSAGFMPGSAKDPVFKFKWFEDRCPEIYSKAYKWLDIKDYIILKLTGVFATTKDNAHAYTIYNSKKNNGSWSKTNCKSFEVDMNKLPNVIESTDIVGGIKKEIAEKIGVSNKTKIIGGIIDSTGVQYGSGAVDVKEMMVYWGTSGWVGTVTNKLCINPSAKIGALIAGENKKYHYYAVLESAGISYNWIKDHIIEDDGMLGSVNESTDSIYDKMNSVISKINPGSDGLMYAPWLTGVRAPMESSNVGGMFINFKRNMNKAHFVRAVAEGICYHYRLLMECGERQVSIPDKIRFVGGGANSTAIAQILADITGRTVEIPVNPQYCGAYGAAVVASYALGSKEKSLSEICHSLKVAATYTPNKENHKIYNAYYKIYKKVYKKNKNILEGLTKTSELVGEK